MTVDDLPAIERWLAQPHVARWWTPETTVEAEIADIRRSVVHADATSMLMVSDDDRPIGWCQWYPWAAYPTESSAMAARHGDVGIDYAIGEPDCTGRGLGTQLIALLTIWIRSRLPESALLAAVEATNLPSRRVLEKNGFTLVSTRQVATEPHDREMAIYRLPVLS